MNEEEIKEVCQKLRDGGPVDIFMEDIQKIIDMMFSDHGSMSFSIYVSEERSTITYYNLNQ